MALGGFRIGTAFVEVETRDNSARGLSGIAGTFARWAKGIASSIMDGVGKAFESLANIAGGVLSDALQGVSRWAFNASASLASAATETATLGSATTVSTGGLNFIIPALLAVAGAAATVSTGFVILAPLLLLAGGAAGSLFTAVAGGIAVMATLKIGLSGVGDAFGEVMQNGKATSETLKALSPNARALVHELERIKPQLDSIRKFVQDKLLAGMNVEFRDLATKWLPAAREIMGGLATTLNGIGKKVMQAFGDSTFINNMKTAASGFGSMLDRIGQSIPGLIGAFGRLAAGSVPFLTKIGELLGGALDSFSRWIQKADETGKLKTFMESAAQTLQQIWDIGKQVFSIMGSIIQILFPHSEQAGKGVLDSVKETLTKVAEWLANPENQKKIQDWIQKFKDMVKTIVTEVIPKIAEIVDKVNGWVEKVQGWFDKIANWKQSLSQAWAEIKATAEEKWNAIVTFFTSLPGRILAALAALPGQVKAKFQEMADGALERVGFMIGSAIGTLLTLPGRAASAIAALPGVVSEKFNSAKDMAITAIGNLISSVTSALSGLPGRVAGWLAGLPGAVGGAFSSAASTAASVVSGMVGTVMGLIASIPGRAAGALAGLGGVLVGAGRALIQGLIDGIESKIGPLKSKLAELTSLIPKVKGPIDKDRVLLKPAGEAIMGGLMRGIAGRVPELRDQLGALTAEIPRMGRQANDGYGPQAGGPQYHVAPGAISIDLTQVKSLQQLLDMLGKLQSTSRAYGARTLAGAH